jgi:hypothetical protein
MTRNAYGDLYEADFCPANPDVRAYCRALVSDVARYELSSILAESLQYHGLEHGYHHERYFTEIGARARYLLGLCFCAHCLARASDRGLDGPAVEAAVRHELDRAFADSAAVGGGELELDDISALAGGELGAYLDVRAATVTSLATEVGEHAAAAGKRLVFLDMSGAVKGYATGRPVGGPAADISWRFGAELGGLSQACDGIEAIGYAAEVDRVRLDLEGYRRQLDGADLSVVLRPSAPDCESVENLAAKVALARELGVDRISFYHYGFVRLETLDWIREALEA